MTYQASSITTCKDPVKERKRYPEYEKKAAARRRQEARENGTCQSLCGQPVRPGINPRTGRTYTTCDYHAKQQLDAHKKRKAALAAGGQLTAAPGAKGKGSDHVDSSSELITDPDDWGA